MTLDEIIEVTGVTSRNTIKAWMRGEHPRITEPFPAPVTKGGIGKGVRDEWDGAAVYRWWAHNSDKVGRHPK